jgi:hypothetical protein
VNSVVSPTANESIRRFRDITASEALFGDAHSDGVPSTWAALRRRCMKHSLKLAWTMTLGLSASAPISSVARRVLGQPICGAENRLLTGDGVAGLHPGMPIDSVKLLCRVVRDAVEQNEGGGTRYLAILIGPDTLRAEIVDERVDRILVESARFATADGIRVGTRLGRLLAFRGVTGGMGEGEYYVDADASRSLCGLSFRLDFAGRRWPKRIPDGSARSLEPYASSAKVDKILVRGCKRSRNATSKGPA